MGGSGGGGFFGRRVDPAELKQQIDQAVSETERQMREVGIDAVLNELLAAFNSRDYDKTSRYLGEIEAALSDEIDGMESLLFGGSVAKRTYVDGLSDVDSVVIIDKEEVETTTPDSMLSDFAEALRLHLPQETVKSVSAGSLAVTVEYRDGIVLQLLPAARLRSGLMISDGRSGWREIKPKEFTDTLTRENQRLTRSLVPTIKLAKAALSKVPEDIRPTGYHVEALALRVFEDYRGEHRTRMMLPHFFSEAARAVLKPMADVTGQSRQLDADLGLAGSDERRRLAATCERLARRLEGARSPEEWREALELTE